MRKLLFLFVCLLALGGSAAAQDAVPSAVRANSAVSSNNLVKDFDEYTIELPNEQWRVTSKTANAEVVFVDRRDGLLQIRKIEIEPGATFAEAIDREQTQKLQFLPGFVNGKEESFKGVLTGKVANYEFTQSGKPMIGRAYFLKADDKTVYVLRFTGMRDKLRAVRNQTDGIARNFELKKK